LSGRWLKNDAAVVRVLDEAQAAALLKSDTGSISTRLTAVHEVAAQADLSARSLLSSLHGQPPPVEAAIGAAIHDIDRQLQLWGLAEDGLSLGAVLLLAATGLAITFGVMGVINMAHGEMVMIGAYTTFVVQQLIAAFAPALEDLGLFPAVPAAFLVAGSARHSRSRRARRRGNPVGRAVFRIRPRLAASYLVIQRGEVVASGRREDMDEAAIRNFLIV
jgi:urea transport system permease protein